MTTCEEIIAAAKEAGMSIVGGDDGTDTQCWTGDISFDDDGLERFYAIAFEAGRVAEREECAREAEYYEHRSPVAKRIAKDIRARGTGK